MTTPTVRRSDIAGTRVNDQHRHGDGERRPHVVVIGAGFTGLCAAWELARRGVPLVFMDVGRVGPRMSHVLIDYAHGIRQAVDHVAGLGHKRIGFITGPLASTSAT